MKIKTIIADYIQDFIHLFYPPCCPTCGQPISKGEQWLCLACINDIPESFSWKDSKNTVNQLFWGRTNIEFAAAYMFFSKQSKYRKLLHLLKYQNAPHVGIEMGRLMGQALAKGSLFGAIDYILPIPLHPKKEAKRGYNQSEMLAKGLAEYLQCEVSVGELIRCKNTSTQTKKNKEERQRNVANAFALSPISELKGKRILLIDDVITTGSTIESCAKILIEEGKCQVSVYCFAMA